MRYKAKQLMVNSTGRTWRAPVLKGQSIRLSYQSHTCLHHWSSTNYFITGN
uniref:(NDV) L protein n=1 Tax=Avian paramyxovirus 1 TaxID=2560319 RepID=Q84210_NCDV|nr:unnamed protein product [avian paramyxovirus 1]